MKVIAELLQPVAAPTTTKQPKIGGTPRKNKINAEVGQLLTKSGICNDEHNRNYVKSSVRKLTVRLKALFGRKYEQLPAGSEAAIAEYIEWSRIFVPFLREKAHKSDLAQATDLLLGSSISEWPPCPADFRRVLNDIATRPRFDNTIKLDAPENDPEVAKRCMAEILQKLKPVPSNNR